MTSHLVVADLDLDDPRWLGIVSRALGASPMHHPDIVRAEARLHGGDVTAIGAWRGAELVGGLAVTTRDGRVHPRSIVSYNGPLVAPLPGAHPRTRHRHEADIVGALLTELTRRHRSVHLRMRPGTFDVRALVDDGWSTSLTFTYHVDIGNLDRAWQRIDQNRRRLIRRADRHGLSVHEHHGDAAHIARRVADLHSAQMHRHGQQPIGDVEVWRRVLDDLLTSGRARLFVTQHVDAGMAAFVLVTTTTPLAMMLASGSDPAHLDDGATAVLRWQMFESLAGEGVTTVDLHGARPGPHGRFKASFGGELVERWDLVSPTVGSWRAIPRHLAQVARDDVRSLRRRT